MSLSPSSPWPPNPQTEEILWPPNLTNPTPHDCHTLCALRKIPARAFYTAGLLGTLKIANYKALPAWIITDRNGLVAEARRLDGLPWPGGQKSLALKGSKKTEPVGLVTWNSRFDELKDIVLVEGAPDYYAALCIAIDFPHPFRPGAVLGAACSIRECYVDGYLEGTNIVIIPHSDESGRTAAERWGAQLLSLSARRVEIQDLPSGFKDLNDFVSQYPNSDDSKDLLRCLIT